MPPSGREVAEAATPTRSEGARRAVEVDANLKFRVLPQSA